MLVGTPAIFWNLGDFPPKIHVFDLVFYEESHCDVRFCKFRPKNSDERRSFTQVDWRNFVLFCPVAMVRGYIQILIASPCEICVQYHTVPVHEYGEPIKLQHFQSRLYFMIDWTSYLYGLRYVNQLNYQIINQWIIVVWLAVSSPYSVRARHQNQGRENLPPLFTERLVSRVSRLRRVNLRPD